MKKLLTAAAFAIGLTFSPAQAALIDFTSQAVDAEARSLGNGASLEINNIPVMLLGMHNGDVENFGVASPFLASTGGLGICLSPGANGRCGENGAVGPGEAVGVAFIDPSNSSFLTTRSVTGLSFRNAGDNTLTEGLVTILTANGVITDTFAAVVALAASGDSFFADTNYIGFEFAGADFFVASLNVSDAPLPAAIGFLFSGLAGLWLAARRP